MRRTAGAGLAAALLLAVTVGCAGCAAPAPDPVEGVPAMGMGGDAGAGGMAAGVIAASRDVSMSTPVFRPASGTIELSRVLAPADGWIVVRSTVQPGGVLGSARVAAGENTDVVVRLGAVDGRQVRVALFVDRGVRGEFEFDPERPGAAFDKPVSVDGATVESPLVLSGWGVETNPNNVLVMLEDQRAGSTLDVSYLLLPGPSWIEVRRLEKGVPTARLGLLLRPSGESHRVAVPLDGARSGDEIIVTILADRGTLGSFEAGQGSPLLGADQPWVSAGVVASARLRLE
jgi:hypothetical protein